MPYHDERAVTLALKVMKAWRPTHIVFTGDVDDQLEYSSFSDGTTDEFFNQLAQNKKENAKRIAEYQKAQQLDNQEIPMPPELLETDPLPFVKKNAQVARDFYADVRKQHKNAVLHACIGNHDLRVMKYLDKKAPDIASEVDYDFLYDFKNQGITYSEYHNPPVELFPGIFFHHGDTVSSTGLAVKKDVDNYDISLVRGHDHMGGVVYKTFPLSDRELFGLACGHLCDVKGYGLQYTFNHTWQQGFGIIHIVNGTPYPQFIRINKDYECVVDGKLFSA